MAHVMWALASYGACGAAAVQTGSSAAADRFRALLEDAESCVPCPIVPGPSLGAASGVWELRLGLGGRGDGVCSRSSVPCVRSCLPCSLVPAALACARLLLCVFLLCVWCGVCVWVGVCALLVAGKLGLCPSCATCMQSIP